MVHSRGKNIYLQSCSWVRWQPEYQLPDGMKGCLFQVNADSGLKREHYRIPDLLEKCKDEERNQCTKIAVKNDTLK